MKTKIKYINFFCSSFLLVFLFNVEVQAQTQTADATQDASISQIKPSTNYGSEEEVQIAVDAGSRVCALVEFEDFTLPDSVIIDNAIFDFSLTSQHGLKDVQIDVTPIIQSWDENTVTWNNPATVDRKYTLTKSFKADSTNKIYIEDIATLWADKTIVNHGLELCYNKGLINETSDFTFGAHDSAFGTSVVVINYHYPAVALGNPVDNAQSIDLQYNDDLAVVDMGVVSNVDNSQNVIPVSQEAIALREPKDKEVVTTASPQFKWEYLTNLPQGTKPAIVVKKDDGQKWEALIENEKDTTISREDGFGNGSYKWYMEVLDGDKVVQKTNSWHFEIKANDLDKINKGVQPQPKNTVAQNIVQKNTTQTQPKSNIVQNKKIEDKIETKVKNTTQEIQNDSKEKATQQVFMWGILIGVSIALLILAIVLGIIWYKHKKDKESRDGSK
jgi:tetrahydromethanopterin S-methyltransferase subunit G